MASIIAATAIIPITDINGASIDPSSLVTALLPLTSDTTYQYTLQDRLNSTGVSLGQTHWYTFFILSANSATALAAYNTFKATLAAGTVTYGYFVASTLN
jgi:hypothetical protein